MTRTRSADNGGSVLLAVLIVFVTFKATSVVTWSWWMVTLPGWIGLAWLVVVYVVVFLFMFLVVLPYRAIRDRKSKVRLNDTSINGEYIDASKIRANNISVGNISTTRLAY